MAYKQKGFPKPRKKDSPMQISEQENAAEYVQYQNQMQKSGRGKWLPKLNKTSIGLQLKWWKYGQRFGSINNPGRYGEPEQLTLEQMAQQRMGEELYMRAFRMQAPAATTATGRGSHLGPQGVHFEAVYNTPQFQQFMRNQANLVRQKGGDASLLNFDLSKGYSFGIESGTDWMGKERMHNDGKIHSGKDLNLNGVHSSLAEWKEGLSTQRGFREQSTGSDEPGAGPGEKELYKAKTGQIWGETGMEQLKRYQKFLGKSEEEGGLTEEDRQALGNPTDEELEKLSEFIENYREENDM